MKMSTNESGYLHSAKLELTGIPASPEFDVLESSAGWMSAEDAQAYVDRCEEIRLEIEACPSHLWVIEVYEDEEDGHDLRCERCPAGESDLYDDPWDLMEGEVAPGVRAEQLATLRRRPRSFPVNIEVRWRRVGWEYDEHEAEILVSPRTS